MVAEDSLLLAVAEALVVVRVVGGRQLDVVQEVQQGEGQNICFCSTFCRLRCLS